MSQIKYVSSANLKYALSKVKANFVMKEAGKELISSDLITKLSNIEAGAQVNKLEVVKVNGAALEIDGNKAVNVVVPTKTSEITNDSGFITSADIPEGAAASTTVPLVDGTAAVGTEMAFARGDHRHPTDTSRAAAADLEAEIQRATGKENEIEGKVNTLIGEDANKSARTIAAEETAKIVAGAGESYDTLKEIADWISSHGTDAATMNSNITALQNQLKDIAAGEGTVKKYVDDAIAALSIGDYAKAADLTALAARVQALEDDHLVAADKTALEKAISDGDAATLESAKEYADGLNTAMDARVAALEDVEHVELTTAEIDTLWTEAMA